MARVKIIIFCFKEAIVFINLLRCEKIDIYYKNPYSH